MTKDEALGVVADEVTRAVLQEALDNGLWDAYLDVELADQHSTALRDCLRQRITRSPHPSTLSEALRHLSST